MHKLFRMSYVSHLHMFLTWAVVAHVDSACGLPACREPHVHVCNIVNDARPSCISDIWLVFILALFCAW